MRGSNKNPPKKGTDTPPKTSMEPKNGVLEDDVPFERGDFQVPCQFWWGVASERFTLLLWCFFSLFLWEENWDSLGKMLESDRI